MLQNEFLASLHDTFAPFSKRYSCSSLLVFNATDYLLIIYLTFSQVAIVCIMNGQALSQITRGKVSWKE